MTASTTRSSDSKLGDLLGFTGYIQVSTKKSMNDCIYALRSNQGTSVLFGGYNTRISFSKPKGKQTDIPFELEYYRLSAKRGRTSYAVQRMKGLLYQENGQTHFAAKVKFTGSTLMWFWLSILLTVLAVGLLIYTKNIVMWVLIGMTGMFSVAMILVMWLDRYHIKNFVRKCLSA